MKLRFRESVRPTALAARLRQRNVLLVHRFHTPSTIYRYDMTTGKSTIFDSRKVDFNPADFETKQVFYTSKDGTKVPMFITHKKGLKLDGNNPDVSLRLRWFQYLAFRRLSQLAFCVDGDGRRLAQPNLRGGGEYRRRVAPGRE
jgi:prolyl oligopeptidase